MIFMNTCERCNLIHSGMYGSGRFCSVKCARSFATSVNRKEISIKVSQKMKVWGKSVGSDHFRKIGAGKSKSKKAIYERKTNLCKYCRGPIPYKRRYHKGCSFECSSKLLGGIRKGSGIGVQGDVFGIHCDSTWEAAYVLYCHDKNFDIKRNLEYWLYVDSKTNSLKKFYPDFIVNGELIEIKGFSSELTDAKIAAVNRKITVLYKSEMKEVFDHILTTYNIKKLSDIYHMVGTR